MQTPPSRGDHLWLPFTPNRHFRQSPRVLVSAKGMYFTTQDGQQVLDGISSLWCVGAGHNRAPINEAIKQQLDTLDYATAFQFGNDRAFEAADMLADLAPGDLNRVFFCTSGSEAADTSLKMALAYHRACGQGQRTVFIGRERGYHGVGFGGMSVGGISGNRIVDLYARWKVDGINLKPDVISILIGVNDTWHEFGGKNGVEVPRFEQFYRMLLEWTVQACPGIKLVLCEPFVFAHGAVGPDWVPEINQRRAITRKMADEFSAIFIPYQDIFNAALKRSPGEYWLADGVHPTSAGHQLMADAWLKATSGII